MEYERGSPFPFGTHTRQEGVNFAIYANHVKDMKLRIYNEDNLTDPLSIVPFDPSKNKTGDVWHIFIKQLPPVFAYAYEVTLEHSSEKTYIILDPYAKSVATDSKWYAESRKEFTYQPLGKHISDHFDWEGDIPLNIPKKDLIIYEMHVRGFTAHASSQVSFPGTFKGVIEKIPYLKELGINTIELMPIQEFCEEDVIQVNPRTQKKLHNYFGYSTVNFFSLMNRYASESKGPKAIHEFKNLVKELHKNGIEVLLDVVFNHTFEGNEKGPVSSFKALDNDTYYMINGEKQYLNFSGCGNTFNCNHPIVRELIISSLRHWVLEYHVDGFRFDLASVFNRRNDGTPLDTAPLMEFISKDPVLSATKLIAEPWDAGGLYQVGSFASWSSRWSEWNGKFQKEVRNFIKGTPHKKNIFAGAICGSHEIYSHTPYSSINYIVAHDGFSLKDLVSYNHKHNEENGENNQDGENHNESWNCGYEGETDKKRVIHLRRKQMRNFHFALMISQGIPMVFMGDEYGHTRQGNNNPWCQDNELNWFLWDKLKEEQEFFRFYKHLIQFRKNNDILRQETFLADNRVKWHGENPEQPEWDKDNRLVALSLHSVEGSPELYIAFNASHFHRQIKIPSPGHQRIWKWIVNTNNASPNDFFEDHNVVKLNAQTIDIAPYSSLMLKAIPN